MKKISLLIVSILFFSFGAHAQGIDLGIKGGVNFSNITDASGLSNRTGFVFGAFAGIKFNDKLGIQGDLLYSQQGAELDPEAIDLNYVNIPVVLRYFIFKGLNLQAGPQFGFVIDDNVKEISNNFTEAESFDLTGVVGVGYDLPLGLRVDGRYNFGLTDVFNNTSGKNSIVTLAVGYSFL
jgi:hypothetical protein